MGASRAATAHCLKKLFPEPEEGARAQAASVPYLPAPQEEKQAAEKKQVISALSSS
jgi:hypothetical protein